MKRRIILGFPGGSEGKESPCNAGNTGWIPESGRSPGEGNCNPLQYSCLGESHGQRSLAGYSPWNVKVAQSCPTLCDPMDYIVPPWTIQGILQARILEWVDFPSLFSEMVYLLPSSRYQGFPVGSDGQESTCHCRKPGFNPWVGKIPLEKGMATHSSILAWEIPWMEELGGLQSMASQSCIRLSN